MWVRIDDQFFLNPKVISAGRDASEQLRKDAAVGKENLASE